MTELFFLDARSLQEDNCLWVIPRRLFPLLRWQPITSRSQNTSTCSSNFPNAVDGALCWWLCHGMPYLHTRGLESTNSERGMSGSRPHWLLCLTLSHQGTRAPTSSLAPKSYNLCNILALALEFCTWNEIFKQGYKWPRPDSSRKGSRAHPQFWRLLQCMQSRTFRHWHREQVEQMMGGERKDGGSSSLSGLAWQRGYSKTLLWSPQLPALFNFQASFFVRYKFSGDQDQGLCCTWLLFEIILIIYQTTNT